MRIRVLVVAVLALAAGIACYAAWKQMGRAPGAERFDVPDDREHDAKPGGAAAARSSYDNRLFVLQTFQSALGRKPSDAELARMSRMASKAAIRAAIAELKDGGEPKDAPAAAACVEEGTDDVVHDDKKKARGKGARRGHGDGDSDSEDDDDCSAADEPRRRNVSKKHPAAKKAEETCDQPVPYSPDRVHKASEASPDEIWRQHRGSGGGGGGGGDARRVCMDRGDLVGRLEAIAQEIEQFRQFVAML
jgi:hypothetical protein